MTFLNDCSYCNPKIEKLCFLESNHFRALYNPVSVTNRFGIIIPKKHIKRVTDLSSSKLGEMMNLGKRSVELLQDTFQVDSYRWVIQGTADSSCSNHMQIHLVPEENSLIKLGVSMDEELDILCLPESIEKITLNGDEIHSAVEKLKKNTKHSFVQK